MLNVTVCALTPRAAAYERSAPHSRSKRTCSSTEPSPENAAQSPIQLCSRSRKARAAFEAEQEKIATAGARAFERHERLQEAMQTLRAQREAQGVHVGPAVDRSTGALLWSRVPRNVVVDRFRALP